MISRTNTTSEADKERSYSVANPYAKPWDIMLVTQMTSQTYEEAHQDCHQLIPDIPVPLIMEALIIHVF